MYRVAYKSETPPTVNFFLVKIDTSPFIHANYELFPSNCGFEKFVADYIWLSEVAILKTIFSGSQNYKIDVFLLWKDDPYQQSTKTHTGRPAVLLQGSVDIAVENSLKRKTQQ